MSILLLLAPDIALIVIGLALHRRSGWSEEFWTTLEKLVYYLLFPALLFTSIVRAKFDAAAALPMLATALTATAAGIALGYAARPVLRAPARQWASGAQCAFRFNSYVALALSSRLGGEPGLALCSLLVGCCVPILNVASVWPLARHARTGFAREVLRNPLILATVGGLAANLAGLTLPEPVAATLTRLGQASLALGLLLVGAGLRLRSGSPALPVLSVWITATKLVAMPLVALLAGRALGLAPLPMTIAVMFAAMPTASASYVLANRMGGDGPFVARLITASMLGALIGLPFWLSRAG